MRHPFASASLTVVALALASHPVASQTIPSAFEYLEDRQEIGAYFGTMSAGTGRFGFGPDGGAAYGAQYAVELSGPLGFEARSGFVDGHRQVVDPSRLPGEQIIGEVDSQILTVDVGFRFTFTGRRSWHGFAPFLSAHAGIAMDMLDTSSLDETLLPADVFDFGNSFLGSMGLGTRWFVTDRIATRFDARFSLWKLDTPPGFSDPDRGFEDVSDGEWVSGNTLTLTLLYRW